MWGKVREMWEWGVKTCEGDVWENVWQWFSTFLARELFPS